MKPPYPAFTLVSLNHHVYPSPLFRDDTWDQDLGTHYPSRVPTSGVASCVSPVFSFENELTSMFTPFPPPKKFAMVDDCPCTRNYVSRSKYRLTEAPIEPNYLTRTLRTTRPLISSLALWSHPCGTPCAHAETFRREPRPAHTTGIF